MPSSTKWSLAILMSLLSAACLIRFPEPVSERFSEIHGLVHDHNGPVAGARVRVQGTPLSALTDHQGRFHLVPGSIYASSRVTAWKDGYFIAGTPLKPLLDFALVPISTKDHDDYQWVDPAPDPQRSGNCANCHAAIYREWTASGHSRSASGRHFRDLYEGTNAKGEAGISWGLLTQNPDGAAVCASCHAPAIPAEDDMARLDLRHVSGVAARGVHCDYCHKIADVNDGTLGLTHGSFNLRLRRPEADRQLFFGPLDDVDRGDEAYSPLYRDSRYCASCHEGVVFGVHVYSTYSEWLDSPARREGKQCQDCHMAPNGSMTNIAPGHGGIERASATLGNHRFFAPSLEAMLRRAVRVDAGLRRAAGGVVATVSLRAEDVGHRVPTGFIDRHLILHVEARDDSGRILAVQEGPRLPDAVGPTLAGQPGRLFAKLLHGAADQAPMPFWVAGGQVDDNRLSPGRREEMSWRFPPSTMQLRVRVLYRRFWADVQQAKGWPDRDMVVHEATCQTPRR